jgi:hypothetical protein
MNQSAATTFIFNFRKTKKNIVIIFIQKNLNATTLFNHSAYKMLGFYLLKTLQIEVVEAVRLFSVHSAKCDHDSKKREKRENILAIIIRYIFLLNEDIKFLIK